MVRFLKAVVLLFVIASCDYFQEDVSDHSERSVCMSRDMFLPQPFPPFEPNATKPDSGQKKTDWALLSEGKTIGKRVVVQVTQGVGFIDAPVDAFTLAGDDRNALNLNVCISPPKYAYVNNNANLQNLNSAQDNEQILEVPAAAPLDDKTTPALIAILDWGIGGVSNSAEVDFVNGANININASYVRMRIGVEPTAPGIVTAGHEATSIPIPFAEVSTFIGHGIARNEVAQRTFRLFVVGGQVTQLFPVPKFAKKVRALCVNQKEITLAITEGQTTIEFFENPSGTDLLSFMTLGSGDVRPVPNGAQFFRFGNPAAIDQGGPISVIFELAL